MNPAAPSCPTALFAPASSQVGPVSSELVSAMKSTFADQQLSMKALERLMSTLSLAQKGDFSVRMAADGDGVERVDEERQTYQVAMDRYEAG